MRKLNGTVATMFLALRDLYRVPQVTLKFDPQAYPKDCWVAGLYDFQAKKITLHRNEPHAGRIYSLLHEFQHAIQDRDDRLVSAVQTLDGLLEVEGEAYDFADREYFRLNYHKWFGEPPARPDNWIKIYTKQFHDDWVRAQAAAARSTDVNSGKGLT